MGTVTELNVNRVSNIMHVRSNVKHKTKEAAGQTAAQ